MRPLLHWLQFIVVTGYDGRDDDDSIENDVDADANILGSRSTSIMIERNSEDQIMNIFRRDNSS